MVFIIFIIILYSIFSLKVFNISNIISTVGLTVMYLLGLSFFIDFLCYHPSGQYSLSSSHNSTESSGLFDSGSQYGQTPNPGPSNEVTLGFSYDSGEESENSDIDYTTLSQNSNAELRENISTYYDYKYKGFIPNLIVDGTSSQYTKWTIHTVSETVRVSDLTKLPFYKEHGHIIKYYGAGSIENDQTVAVHNISKSDYLRISELEATSKLSLLNASLKLVKSSAGGVFDIGVFFNTNIQNHYIDDIWEAQLKLATESLNIDGKVYKAKEFQTSALWNHILSEIFPRNVGYQFSAEHCTGKGRVDAYVKWFGFRKDTPVGLAHIEYKAFLAQKHWYDQLAQVSDYLNSDNTIDGTFAVLIRGPQVAFFMYDSDFHSSNGFGLKGDSFNGMLGLYLDKGGVKILPQYNNFFPQMHVYDASKDKANEFSITSILRFMSCLKCSPTLVHPDLITGSEPVTLSFTTEAHSKVKIIGTINIDGITKTVLINSDGKLITSNILSQIPVWAKSSK
jgi:hypothetical protein